MSLIRIGREKLQPKLRLLSNGDSVVNTVRAEHCGCTAVGSSRLLRDVPTFRQTGDTGVSRAALQKRDRKARHLSRIPSDIRVNVFVHLKDAATRALPGETSRNSQSRLATLSVPLSDLPKIASRDDVLFTEPGEGLSLPEPVSIRTSNETITKALRSVPGETTHRDGAGVLVGIIDVEGFDFAHPDFLDEEGKSRFVRIWDQGGDRRPPPRSPGYGYGAEFTHAHLNAALKAAPGLGVSPTDIEKQSTTASGSHATHVASIAAGNHGVAPRAVLAGVLISMPPEDQDSRKSFYDSTRIAHAVDYLLSLGEELKLPVSINISLGTNGHAHDGSSAVSRWIDSALAKPGRSVCIAAGNAGQEMEQFAGDLGYVMGRIHTSGQLTSAGLTRDLDWNVVGNGRVDISENELEIWYEAQDEIAVSIRPPGSATWIGPVEPRQFVENTQLPDGSFVSVYSELYHPANGANYIAIYLSPLFSQSGVVGIPSGTWTVRLHGKSIRDGRFHAWIERDDPRRRGRIGDREAWSFPSYFSQRSNVDQSSVSSLACGHRIISVANLDAEKERINITSSEGPTRDGRCKPDIAAPGTEILAANGFASPDEPWIAMTGTSMASPYACGVAALMLATEPRLTAAQIESIMRRTARPLPSNSYVWIKDAGFGVLNPAACIEEAAHLNRRVDVTP